MIRPVASDFARNQSPPELVRGPPVRMDMPDEGWTLDELYNRVAWEAAQIGKSRRSAPRYWYLGKALRIVRKQVPEGAWKAWCIAHRVLDAWKRGLLLTEAFVGSPDPVAHLAVGPACDLARERLGRPRRQTAADARLRRSLARMKKSLRERLAEFSSMTGAGGLRRRIAEVREQLDELERACIALEKRARAAVKPRREKKAK
jgi:hypothetical protein